jgi:hypothetical protein
MFDEEEESYEEDQELEQYFFNFDIDPKTIENIVTSMISSFFINNLNFKSSHISWQSKHFVLNKILIDYKQHTQNNAEYLLNEPIYYRSLFDIMN